MVFRLGPGLGLIAARARPAPTTAPVNTRLPGFLGVLTQGEAYTIDPGDWSGLPSPNFAYSVKRDGVEIATTDAGTWSADDVAAGTDAMTVEVIATNSIGPSDPAVSNAVTIAAALSISGTPGGATVGEAYSFTPTASGGHAPRTFALTGTLPAGLSFNTSTGASTGTPLSSGTASGLTIEVTDADGLTDTLGPFDIVVGSAALTGDALSLTVLSDGWENEVVFNGLSTGQTYTLSPDSSPRAVVSVVRPGFDTSGVATTVADTVVLTRSRLGVYPSEASPTEDANGGDAKITLPGSEYIYVDDEVSQLALLSGAYGASTTKTLSTSITNNSTVAYPKVIADWADLPRNLLGAGLDVEVVAFHKFGRQKLPVAAVKITGTPTTGSAVTKSCTYAKSTKYGDDLPVWKASFADSDFPSNGSDHVTFTFEAFSWVGDAASTRDTSAGSFLSHTAVSAPIIHYTGTPTRYYAFVDGTGAGTPAVSTTRATAKAAPFATPEAAITALATASSGNLSNCVVELMATGSPHTWSSTAPTGTRTAPNAWFIIQGDADDADPFNNISVETNGTSYKALMNNGAGTASFVQFRNMGVTLTASNFGFINGTSSRAHFAFVRVKWANNSASASTWAQSGGMFWFMQCDGLNGATTTGPLFQASATNIRPMLVRACTSNRKVQANTILSTTVDGTLLTGTCFELGAVTNQRTANLIMHNCRVTDWAGTAGNCVITAIDATTHKRDTAIIQCEFVGAAGANQVWMSFGENVDLDQDNILIDYVTCRGGNGDGLRLNVHNDPTTNPTTAVSSQNGYLNFAVKRSLMTWIAVKDSEYRATSEGDTGANFLVDGEVKRHGVGWAHNNSEHDPDQFPPAFSGLNSTRAEAITYDGSGRPTAGAPLIPAGNDNQALTWDIAGVARETDGNGVSGAREAA